MSDRHDEIVSKWHCAVMEDGVCTDADF